MNLNKLTNDQLRAFLDEEAARFGIFIEDCACGGVEVRTPEGKCFDTDLHGLVNSPYDRQTYRHCLLAALKDIRESGPRVRDCELDCPCRETD